jgi:ppGpp synthetase/RelA/SpoT-type nucleotidyltranferase
LAEAGRTIEDPLREEYFQLLPEIRRVAGQLQSQINYHLLPIANALESHEQLVVKSRIKECESAVNALRRRSQEGATFDNDQPTRYTLANLNDLAGVRILVFPQKRIRELDQTLRDFFTSWTADPVKVDGQVLALKYHGYCNASERIRGEYQIVSMLTGLFWEVEHSAIYKPAPRLRSVARSFAMQQRSKEVLNALKAFEDEFEALIHLKHRRHRLKKVRRRRRHPSNG